ncbi:peptidoglycan-binding protein [Streptomyces sp. BR123]|uniref:peptidoglycan-binding protein n=1 Tax=Streptomyces sp. BR123 TaxID=2749828 RepID=UPI0015C4E5BC|nr:peptidoglycan-binding protein [Streptomyces sp. BR123]NXY97327.1 peptidoglycan-binding protein [Streptomyces sp. BR123]
MPTPVFEEYEPAGDCGCPGCVHRRRSLARTPAIALRDGGHPAARAARRALVLATAAGVVLTGGTTVPAAMAHAPAADSRDGDGPASPQGARSPLHGRPAAPVKPGGTPGAPSSLKRIDRMSIISRAQLWLDAKVPYSMYSYWLDGYRQDCSGYVSMAWNLGTNEWTGSLDKFATKITKDELLPGDMLLFHNPADPNNGSHVTLFGGWVDGTHTHYIAYEQTRPNTRKLATPYGYWNNASKYVPYRYNGVTGGNTAPDANPALPSKAYPGLAMFGPGADNRYVYELGRMLIDRGGRRFYPNGPSTKWSDSDLLATQAFQIAQGWTGADVDGIPGPHTWQLLVDGQGSDILPTLEAAPGPSGSPARPGAPGSAARPGVPNSPARPGAPRTPGSGAVRPGPAGMPAYPGAAVFRPGSTHRSIAALGRRLTEKGFGKHYPAGPGPRWGEADRRSVEAFQRAQGWRGAAANGHPGPETWRRLFA